jgi:hypothetical protein
VSYRITVRTGPHTAREKAESVDDAIEVVKRHVRGLRHKEPVNALGRTYEPGQLVAIRIELKGPNGRAGMDVLGDGGLVAFTGRFRRTVIGEGEDPYEALKAALTG